MSRTPLRRERASRAAVVAAVAAAALVVAPSLSLAQAPLPQFSLLDLGTLGGSRSEAYDINNAGQIVGYAKTDIGLDRAFRTAPSAAINPLTDDLGVLDGGFQSYAYS